MKLNEKQANLLAMLIMVITMTGIVTFIMSIINNNFLLFKWIKGWGISILIAYPTVLVIMPISKKIVSKLIN